MSGETKKSGGFQTVTEPKQDFPDGGESRRRRRDPELAKTAEAPPPSAALKPTKRGVDPLAQTADHQRATTASTRESGAEADGTEATETGDTPTPPESDD